MNRNDPRLITARQLARQIGSELRVARTETGMSLRDVYLGTGISKATMSHIEHGKHVPTASEWEQLGDLFDMPAGPPAQPESARVTDPNQSHTVVRSIAADVPMRERIIQIAADLYPSTFDDTDLVAEFQTRWPRPVGQPWQRNVIARARGLIHSYTVDEPVTRLGGARYRMEDPYAPIIRAGHRHRPERGRNIETAHFVYNPEENRHAGF